jgi:thiamine phosphate synthase YjbQ (UPF0047 family)
MTTEKIEVLINNQYHPSLLLLPLPLDQRRYLHHLVLPEEMIIQIFTITTVVEKEGEEEMVEIGIIVVQTIDDMTMIVMIEEGEEAEEVWIDMMIEIAI